MSGAFHELSTAGGLKRAASLWPDNEALIMGDERITYAALYSQSFALARGLAALGLKPGQHLGLLMPNNTDFIRLFYAAGFCGARAVLLNARYRESELKHVIAAADVDQLVISGSALPHMDFRTMLARVFPELAAWDGKAALSLAAAPRLSRIFNLHDARETIWPGRETLEAAARDCPPERIEAAAAAVKPEDISLMMFSSGTTALPKACMLTHKSLALTGQAFAERFKLTPSDRIWNPLPFFHMSTMLPQAAARHAGAAVIARAHFDAAEGLAELQRERVTVSYATFPTMMSALISQPDFPRADLSSLRIVHCVGPEDLLRRYGAVFPRAHIFNAYGLTEATGVAVYSSLDDAPELSFTANGPPFPGVSVRIVDPETEAPLPEGARGEIQFRGFVVFEGYYRDAEATAKALRPGGWLRTGDLGRLDHGGRVIYDGRLKDMLKIGGENVAALEIESHLSAHPDVMVAQVIGVPDEHLFEAAAAFLELKPGARLTPEDIVRHCAGRIASFKIPRYVRFVKSWPMSATKIQKFQLAKDFRPEGRLDVKGIVKGGAREAEA